MKVVEYLLKAHANPNMEDRWGGRPLDDAMRYEKHCYLSPAVP